MNVDGCGCIRLFKCSTRMRRRTYVIILFAIYTISNLVYYSGDEMSVVAPPSVDRPGLQSDANYARRTFFPALLNRKRR